MSKKGFAKLVIAVGVLMMIIGMNMDVTVGYGVNRVANIHLISQQQMLMMFGGFVFLGGLILFGVARMKQTNEDEAREAEKEQEAIEVGKRKAEELIENGSRVTAYVIGNLREILKRMLAGAVAGVLGAALYDNLSRIASDVLSDVIFEAHYSVGRLIEWAIILGSLAFVLRSKDYIRVVELAYAISLRGFGLLLLFFLVISNFLTLTERVIPELTVYLVVSLISYLIARKARVTQRRTNGNVTIYSLAFASRSSDSPSLRRFAVAVLSACLALITAIAFKLVFDGQQKLAEADRQNLEAKIIAAESTKRMANLTQELANGTALGYRLGDRNLKQLTTVLTRPFDISAPLKILECSIEQCSALLTNSPLSNSLQSIQFDYCINEKGDEDKNDADSYQLSKVSLLYRKEAEAKADFEYINAKSLRRQQVDTNTIIEVEVMDHIIFITRKRGAWDACGN